MRAEMILLVTFHILFLNFFLASPLTINCEDRTTSIEVEKCLLPFKEYYDKGIEILTQVNFSVVDHICSKYDEARTCLVMYMHFCPDIKKRYNAGVKSFEYACTADRTGEWPYNPTLTQMEEFDEETERKNSEFYGDLIKISIAAVVTLLLVAVCATAELTSKFKVRSRIKRATASISTHNPDKEELLKKAVEEKEARVQHA